MSHLDNSSANFVPPTPSARPNHTGKIWYSMIGVKTTSALSQAMIHSPNNNIIVLITINFCKFLFTFLSLPQFITKKDENLTFHLFFSLTKLKIQPIKIHTSNHISWQKEHHNSHNQMHQLCIFIFHFC